MWTIFVYFLHTQGSSFSWAFWGVCAFSQRFCILVTFRTPPKVRKFLYRKRGYPILASFDHFRFSNSFEMKNRLGDPKWHQNGVVKMSQLLGHVFWPFLTHFWHFYDFWHFWQFRRDTKSDTFCNIYEKPKGRALHRGVTFCTFLTTFVTI